MNRKRYEWKLKNRHIQLGDRTLIVAILNVTPDSFSDGGRYAEPDRAFARAIELEEQGADILDIGAESTRPGAQRVPEAEEIRRLIPVLKRLRDKLSIPISIDTYKSGVAEKALDLGAEIINDPSALTFDPLLSKVVTQYDAGLILNHMRGTPETWAKLPPMRDVVGTILKDLETCVHRATRAGVDRARKEENAEILAWLKELARLEVPVMVGPSRKSFLAQKGERETEFATAAAVAAAVLGGAHMVRVHDVKAMAAAAQVADAVLRAQSA
jgi:dihydropteroate synthase